MTNNDNKIPQGEERRLVDQVEAAEEVSDGVLGAETEGLLEVLCWREKWSAF